MKKIAGIYILLNVINGKSYVGSSVNVNGRINKHFSLLRRGKHKNKHLQSAWKKYYHCFVGLILEEFSNGIYGKLLRFKEKDYISDLRLCDRKFGYNIQKDPTDNSGENHPMFGVHRYGKDAPNYGNHAPHPSMQGKNHPNWKGGPQNIKCDYCRKEFKRSTKHINKNKQRDCKNYCSKECRYKALSKKASGKKNPMYGKDPWNKGKTRICFKATEEKISESVKKR